MKKSGNAKSCALILLLVFSASCGGGSGASDQAVASERPRTASQYIILSLDTFHSNDFTGSVEACKKALELEPGNHVAYNNMCAAYNKLGKWDEAISACKSALARDPTFELARNNLRLAEWRKARN